MSETVTLRVIDNDTKLPLKAEGDTPKRLPLKAEHVRVVYVGEYPTYDGETTVTPQVSPQTLDTHEKLLLHDITIKAIPYYETSNLSGGYTAVIGG